MSPKKRAHAERALAFMESRTATVLTKHQPATPLPWRAQNWTSHAPTTVLVDDPTTPTRKKVVANCEAYEPIDRERDAAYLVHAANAYQRLVAALQGALGYVDYVADNGNESADRHAANMRAVLRELGERAE